MASSVLRALSRLPLLTATRTVPPSILPISNYSTRRFPALHQAPTHPTPLLMPAAALQRQPRRHMARPTYTRAFFMDVIMLNLRLFDKIDPNKLTLDSHFHKDLGLDSLDHVEIIMAVEDEYSFEIPDSDAQKLLTPRAIVNYLCDKYEIYENIHNWDKDGPTKPKVEECAPEDPWEKSGKKGAAH